MLEEDRKSVFEQAGDEKQLSLAQEFGCSSQRIKLGG
jgi:hypothetical protein